jgi:glycosyltransferase involved in cell wall biosynthesis
LNESNAPQKRKRILILAPFLSVEDAWIHDFCNRPSFEFKKAPYVKRTVSWHKRGAVTSPATWLAYLNYAHQAMKWKADCIVTSFPQLALVAAALLLLTGRRSTRLVAWNFNVGGISSKWRGYLAGIILRRVDMFIVHARSEICTYSKWLGLDEARFRFVPLQRGAINELKPSPIQKPYIVSMGSANRDYRTLVNAVLGTGIKTVLISKKSVIEGLPDHPDLVKLHGLSQDECKRILGGAELNVVPIAATEAASGQITFVTSMRMGIPTVTTRCVGTVDYIRHGQTGFLVPPGDPHTLQQVINSLWRDEALRRQIGAAGRTWAEEHWSDEAAGHELGRVIDEVLAKESDAVERSERPVKG